MKSKSFLALAIIIVVVFSSCISESEQLEDAASNAFCSDFRELTELDGGEIWDANADTQISLYQQLVSDNQDAAASLVEATENLIDSTDKAGTPEYGVAFGSVGLLCIEIGT